MSTAKKSFGVLLLGAAGLMAMTAGQALAGEILKASSAKESATAERLLKADRTIKRRRLVDINAAELALQILPTGADKAANRVSLSNGLSGDISLQLFGDVKIALKRQAVEAAFGGGVVWSGQLGAGTATAFW